MSFRWRSVQRRPAIHCTIARAPHEAWNAFARFHYLTADIHRNARIYVLSVEGVPAACCGVLFRPHQRVQNLVGMSRLVTLPDFQGLGLAFALADRVAAAYRAAGWRYHAYPAHPSLIRSFDRSEAWELHRKPGMQNTTRAGKGHISPGGLSFGGRPCAVFAYCGPAMENREQAKMLIA